MARRDCARMKDDKLMRVRVTRLHVRPLAGLGATVAVVVSLLTSASAAPRQRRGGGGFFRQPSYDNTWMYDGSFIFCRIAFRQAPYPDGAGWYVDYPRADMNLPFRMGQLTTV